MLAFLGNFTLAKCFQSALVASSIMMTSEVHVFLPIPFLNYSSLGVWLNLWFIILLISSSFGGPNQCEQWPLQLTCLVIITTLFHFGLVGQVVKQADQLHSLLQSFQYLVLISFPSHKFQSARCTHKVWLSFGINKFNSRSNLVYLDPWKLLGEIGTYCLWSLDPPKANKGWICLYLWLVNPPCLCAISVFSALSEVDLAWLFSYSPTSKTPQKVHFRR